VIGHFIVDLTDYFIGHVYRPRRLTALDWLNKESKQGTQWNDEV
jgi:hypothetical protein